MKLIIENTSKIVELNGVPARIWEGETSTGIKVHCYIVRVAKKDDEHDEEFAKELRKEKTPSAAVEAIPLRLIL